VPRTDKDVRNKAFRELKADKNELRRLDERVDLIAAIATWQGPPTEGDQRVEDILSSEDTVAKARLLHELHMWRLEIGSERFMEKLAAYPVLLEEMAERLTGHHIRGKPEKRTSKAALAAYEEIKNRLTLALDGKLSHVNIKTFTTQHEPTLAPIKNGSLPPNSEAILNQAIARLHARPPAHLPTAEEAENNLRLGIIETAMLLRRLHPLVMLKPHYPFLGWAEESYRTAKSRLVKALGTGIIDQKKADTEKSADIFARTEILVDMILYGHAPRATTFSIFRDLSDKSILLAVRKIETEAKAKGLSIPPDIEAARRYLDSKTVPVGRAVARALNPAAPSHDKEKIGLSNDAFALTHWALDTHNKREQRRLAVEEEVADLAEELGKLPSARQTNGGRRLMPTSQTGTNGSAQPSASSNKAKPTFPDGALAYYVSVTKRATRPGKLRQAAAAGLPMMSVAK